MWAGGGAHRLKKHFIRLGTQGQAQRAIAVIRVEPVIAGPERRASGTTSVFVSSSRQLEVDLLLALQQDFPVINAPGREHVAVGLDELVASKPFIGLRLLRAIGRKGQFGVSSCRRHPVPGVLTCCSYHIRFSRSCCGFSGPELGRARTTETEVPDHSKPVAL